MGPKNAFGQRTPLGMQQMRLPCRTAIFDRRRCGRGRHAPVVRTWIRGYCRGSSCSSDSSSTKPCSSTNRWTLTAEVSLVRQGVSSYSLHSVPPDIRPVISHTRAQAGRQANILGSCIRILCGVKLRQRRRWQQRQYSVCGRNGTTE